MKSGQLAHARQLWLPAHLDYERLGGAYGAFGSFDAEINGTALSLQGGVTSPYFTGFFALEYGLWGGQATSELSPTAVALDQAVHSLIAQFPHLPMAPTDLGLDTYEILENTLQYEMTGETDEGSNTDLATAWANVEGTQMALTALGPVLKQSGPGVLARPGARCRRNGGSFQGLRGAERHLGAAAVVDDVATREPGRAIGQPARGALGGTRASPSHFNLRRGPHERGSRRSSAARRLPVLHGRWGPRAALCTATFPPPASQVGGGGQRLGRSYSRVRPGPTATSLGLSRERPVGHGRARLCRRGIRSDYAECSTSLL